MSSNVFKTLVALVATSSLSFSSVFADTAALDADYADITVGKSGESFYDSYIKGHLEIGLRWASHELDTPTKYDPKTGLAFIGTISELQEDDSFALYPVITYNFTKWFGFGFTWDSLSATAHTAHTNDKHNDGEFTTKGPTLSAILTIPLFDGKFVPYGEIGGNFASADFDAEYWWEYGYGSPADYQSMGSPKDGRPRNGKHRVIEAKEATKTGLVYGYGAKLYFTENLCLDLAYRHVNADADTLFYVRSSGRRITAAVPTKIPLDYSMFTAGLRYAF